MIQAARLLVIIVIIQSCYTGESSPVTPSCVPGHPTGGVKITVKYKRPETFDRFMHLPENIYYRAGTPLTLICNASGVERAFYHWTSTCSNCFANQLSDVGVITAPYLRSCDSGVHTCTVRGSKEEMGHDCVNITVVGAGIYDANALAGLENNSLIVDREDHDLDFKCLSGSMNSGVGDVYDINEADITISGEDAFFTFERTIGGIHVQSSRDLYRNESGIYSCVIPDEKGEIRTVYVGLYSKDEEVTLEVSMNKSVLENGKYKINCTTTDSPPTKVTWIRDDKVLPISENEGMYTSYQEVINRSNSTYDNVLVINGDASGVYRCNISNLLHNESAELTIRELEVTGHEETLIVGVKRVLRCTAYFNVTSMMWYKPTELTVLTRSEAPKYHVDLELAPESIELNNARFTCKGVTVSGHVFVREVTIKVREFVHQVSITGPPVRRGPPPPWTTDNEYTLSCNAHADISQETKWVDANGNPVVEDDALTITGKPMGENTTLNLTFTKPNASHAGMYKCLSIAHKRMPPSHNSSYYDVFIKLPKPTVMVYSVPINAEHITGFDFNLMCTSLMDQAVDTDVNVTHTWHKNRSWRPIKNSTRINVFPADREFNSILEFSRLRKWDDGSYVCKSTVYPAPHDPKYRYLEESEEEELKIPYVISTFLKANVSISYDPPEEYPDSAIGYRAASSVTLSCERLGESAGTLYYRWTSTCKSCLARSFSKANVTEKILRTRDAGIHTCTVTDSRDGSRGSNSTHMMKTVGAGIYVEKAQYFEGAQPNNAPITIYSAPRSNGTSYLRFKLWCCSNSTVHRVGSITDPNGRTHTGHFKDLRVYPQSWSSHYAGCIQLDGYEHYSNHLNYDSGVYTCTIPDVSGKNHTIHFGLYDSDTQNVPNITRFDHNVSISSVLTLICETKDAPPTEITWKKDGKIITESVHSTQIVTDRNSSYYISTLSIEEDHVDKYIDDYTVVVSNYHGKDEKNHSVEGIKIKPSRRVIQYSVYVGDLSYLVKFNCSSDLFPSSIEWTRGGSPLSPSEVSNGYAVIDELISTDDHGVMYSCEAINSQGSQVENFTIEVEVPDDWASVKITDDTEREPLHDNNHDLTCTVEVKPGMNIRPEIHWYKPDGTQVTTDGRVRESRVVNREDRKYTRTLEFVPVLHDDGGDYTCSATVDVPWMSTPERNSTFNLIVTTQAYMQLRIEALPHCSTWKPERTYRLERSIKKNIESVVREKCGDNFNFSEIHSGEFSCRTRKDAVTYRAIVNGSSESCRASKILEHIQEWKKDEGTLLHGKFRLQLTTSCDVTFKTFSELECTGDGEGECNKGVFDPNTCYRFKSCDDGSDTGSGGN